MKVLVNVPSMDQIKLFNYLLKIIIISFLKPQSCVQIVDIRKEFLIIRNFNVEK